MREASSAPLSFGLLTVTSGHVVGARRVECACSCGNVCTVRADHLKSGATKSCGCLRRVTGRRLGPRSMDLSGRKFGSLLVLERAIGRKHTVWLCRCDCGAVSAVRASHLQDGTTSRCRECGRLAMSESKTLHGATRGQRLTPTYRSWMAMRRRCSDAKRHNFGNWGGRGIKVCPRWEQSFSAFLDDMGERPAGMTLDRINNDGDYEPGNVRWATWVEQANNRRPPRKETVR